MKKMTEQELLENAVKQNGKKTKLSQEEAIIIHNALDYALFTIAKRIKFYKRTKEIDWDENKKQWQEVYQLLIKHDALYKLY
jgi:hypothetical protein